MPTKYVPKHRSAPERAPRRVLPPVVRKGLALTSVAAAVTGVAVAGGTLGAPDEVTPTAQDIREAPARQAPVREGSAQDSEDRSVSALAAGALNRAAVSRSAVRRGNETSKASLLSADSGPARTDSVDLSDGDPRDIARALMPEFGFSADQFGCLDSLWTRESQWNPAAHNPSSGAHGIPQSLPGSKMAAAGADWETNPVTQITWGLGYIQDRYGSPCGALSKSDAVGWY